MSGSFGPDRLSIAGLQVRASRGWLVVITALIGITVNTLAPSDRPAGELARWHVAALIVVIGAAASLLLHDLAHALVARATGGVVRTINPHLFGGLPDEAYAPDNPSSEARVAIAGPLASLALALLLGAGWLWLSPNAGLISGALGFLALVNLALALANAMPGFPLDGGRLFRAFVWYLTDDLIAGTRVATAYGHGIALAGLASGLFLLSLGEFVAIWGAWILLGFWTINNAGRDGYLRTLWRETSRRLSIDDAGLAIGRRVDGERTVDDAIDDLLQAVTEGPLLVMDHGAPAGVVSMAQIRRIPRAIWTQRRVRDTAIPLSDLPRVDASRSLHELVERFESSHADVILIEAGGSVRSAVDLGLTMSRVREFAQTERSASRRRRG